MAQTTLALGIRGWGLGMILCILMAQPSWAQDPALIECIKQLTAEGFEPDPALLECKSRLENPTSIPTLSETPVAVPPPDNGLLLTPPRRRQVGEVLPNGAVYLGNVFGFDANTDDLKRAIGDLPLLDNMKVFPEYDRMVQLIEEYPPSVVEEARQVIDSALAGQLSPDQSMPNNTRWVLQRFLTFKTYGYVVI